MTRQTVLIVAAAAVVSAALILPTSGVIARDWTTVTMNHMLVEIGPVTAYPLARITRLTIGAVAQPLLLLRH